MSQERESFTIGVEEEFQIIDPLTYALSPDVERILPQARQKLGEAVQQELMLSQIEVATPICHTLTEVRNALTHLRREVIGAAEQAGKRLAPAGTHPFSPCHQQLIPPKLPYHK